MNRYPRLVVAGLRGGSGKTMLSLGIVRACKNKGLKVVAFKKGPDYIDAGWLASAAKSPCYNLDPFLIGRDRLLSSFIRHSEGSDIALIEGNRGLFDGVDEEGTYSTAELSKTLKSPIVMILDCNKSTRTIAAVVLGVQAFDKDLDIKGVILNQVAGGRHESVIRKSIGKYCKIPVLGAIPRLDKDVFPERHMGLTPCQEHPQVEEAIERTADIVSRCVDIDRVLEIARDAKPLNKSAVRDYAPRNPKSKINASIRIGVIRDSAFQFYYPENLEELSSSGASIIKISALTEKKLPDIDALYIGGGFPETHAIALAENVEFRNSLRNATMKGLPVYAECGGLMYLGEALLLENRMYQMAGIFPLVFSLEKRPQAHGYSIAEVVKENPYFPNGTILRGHEFHYSRPVNAAGDTNGFYYAFRMKRGSGIYEDMDGICYKNVLATYTHLHAIGAREWVDGMIKQATEYKRAKNQQ